MKNCLADIWQPVKGVNIRDIGDDRFLFQFYHVADRQRIVGRGPWFFDNQMLICHYLQPDESPHLVSLVKVDFWIQVFDLLPGYVSESIGKQLGNFVGKFLEYDVSNDSYVWRKYMRI
ncbi:hypothetical protein PTKIN_Ptkin06aG0121000 [Pterospermum kingtungense]